MKAVVTEITLHSELLSLLKPSHTVTHTAHIIVEFIYTEPRGWNVSLREVGACFLRCFMELGGNQRTQRKPAKTQEHRQ